MKTPNIEYSVIIPTFNREVKLKRAIESCLQQTKQDFEVIVVDDGSTDGTRQYIESINDSRVKYFFQKNSGASSARNNGLSLAAGKYITYLDSDDYYVSNRLEVISKYHEFMDKGVILTSKILFVGTDSQIIKPNILFDSKYSISEYMFCDDGFISTPTIAFSRALASAVKWDEELAYGDDTAYVLALHQSGHEFYMLDMPLVYVDDVSSSDRLSLKKDLLAMDRWLTNNTCSLSERAVIAFKAKHLSFHGFWKRPIYFSYFLCLSVYVGIFSFYDFFKYTLRAALPIRIYKLLLNMYKS